MLPLLSKVEFEDIKRIGFRESANIANFIDYDAFITYIQGKSRVQIFSNVPFKKVIKIIF